jgi:hypothetical protein
MPSADPLLIQKFQSIVFHGELVKKLSYPEKYRGVVCGSREILKEWGSTIEVDFQGGREFCYYFGF